MSDRTIEVDNVTTDTPSVAAQEVAVREEARAPMIATPGGTEVLTTILALARDPIFDTAKMQALIAMQERMEDRQAERAFNAAFVRMQAILPVVRRDGKLEYEKDKGKPETKYLVTKYARWEDIEKAIRPAYTSEGFSLSFKVAPRTTEGGGLLVAAVLRHEAGHTEVGDPIPVPLDTSGGKNNVQAYGSALSYGKRYAAFAALNIVTEGDDDDGVAAGARNLTREQALEMKQLVDAAEIDPKGWFSDMLSYPIAQYLDILNEDFIRLKRALMSEKDKNDKSKAREMKV